MAEPEVYLIDDDTDFREAAADVLMDAGLTLRAFAGSAPMLGLLDPEWPGVILCDVRMAEKDGFATLKEARRIAPEVPFVMITGHGDVRLAITAIKAGAFDFIEKPARPDFLISTIKRALNARKLLLENRRLRARAQRSGGMRSRLLGRSAQIKAVRKLLGDLAPLPITTLLLGVPGTGKALAAEILHDFGEGAGSFQTIACATTSPTKLAEELANADSTGTLFFRSVDRLTPDGQDQIAAFLQAGAGPRVVLSATDRAAISDTLYYLASGATVDMPPLASLGRDVFVLFEQFLRDAAARFGKGLPLVEKDTLKPFARHSWPGNARELRAVAERMVLGLPLRFEERGMGSDSSPDYDTAMEQFERNLLEQTLRETAGRKGEAAARLSIPRKRLYLRMKAVGLLETGQD